MTTLTAALLCARYGAEAVERAVHETAAAIASDRMAPAYGRELCGRLDGIALDTPEKLRAAVHSYIWPSTSVLEEATLWQSLEEGLAYKDPTAELHVSDEFLLPLAYA